MTVPHGDIVTAYEDVVRQRVEAAVADPDVSTLERGRAIIAATEVADRLAVSVDDAIHAIYVDAMTMKAIELRDDAGQRYSIPIGDDTFIHRDNATPEQVSAYRDSLVEERDQARKNRAYLWSLIPDAPLDGPESDGALVKVKHASRQQLEDACSDYDLEIAVRDREIEFWSEFEPVAVKP